MGGSTWQRIADGNLVSISVGIDGTPWGVDANHAIWSFNGSDWQPVPGTMQKVSVGSAQSIAGLDPADRPAFRRCHATTRPIFPRGAVLRAVTLHAPFPGRLHVASRSSRPSRQ